MERPLQRAGLRLPNHARPAESHALEQNGLGGRGLRRIRRTAQRAFRRRHDGNEPWRRSRHRCLHSVEGRSRSRRKSQPRALGGSFFISDRAEFASERHTRDTHSHRRRLQSTSAPPRESNRASFPAHGNLGTVCHLDDRSNTGTGASACLPHWRQQPFRAGSNLRIPKTVRRPRTQRPRWRRREHCGCIAADLSCGRARLRLRLRWWARRIGPRRAGRSPSVRRRAGAGPRPCPSAAVRRR